MKGNCHCQRIKFELNSDLKESYFCHCRDCQILSGSSHHLLGIIDRGVMEINSEELSSYKNKTESGYEMTRYFCPLCSTPIYIESTRFDDIQMVLISTLENPEYVEPSFEIWTNSQLVWKNDLCHIQSYQHGALDDKD